MRQDLVYDLPTRLFHWTFAGLFLTAFLIAQFVDVESSWFNLHSLLGLTLGFVALLRIIWGIFGTRYARFSGFALSIKELINYFLGLLSNSKKKWPGHNPATSWAAITMIILALSLGVTGFLMTSGPDKETYEDIHAYIAYGFIGIVAMHIAGIINHTIRLKEAIGLSMIDGKKEAIPVGQTIQSIKIPYAFLLVILIGLFGLNLFKNYDLETKTLQFFGSTLRLGQSEEVESPAK